jgi:putative N-acetylmannosamine-6-phosphate epimerase
MRHDKTDVMTILVGMIDEVLGDNLYEIGATTSFKDDLAFQSIQFIALAASIQERYDDLDFVAWLTAKELPQVLALRVGDVADFIVASSA